MAKRPQTTKPENDTETVDESRTRTNDVRDVPQDRNENRSADGPVRTNNEDEGREGSRPEDRPSRSKAAAPATDEVKEENRVGFRRRRERRVGFGQRSNKPTRCEEPTHVVVLTDGEWGVNAAVRRVWRKGEIIPNFVGEAKWVRLATDDEVQDYKDAERKKRREAEDE